MKLSISLPEEDVAVLDKYADATGLPSRSAAVHKAISMLRFPELEKDYAAAWDEWQESGEQLLWEATSVDGLSDAQR